MRLNGPPLIAPPAAAVTAGLLACCIGFTSSFAVVLAGLAAVGAAPDQAASGLLALCLAMGIGGIALSLALRMPIGVVWSTPGSALLAAGGVAAGFEAAVGAFLVAAGLTVVAGLWRPLGRAVAGLPPALASAMLAGVLLPICLAPVRAVLEQPPAGLAIVLAWAAVGRVRRLLAVPAALLAAIAATLWTAPLPDLGLAWPTLVPVVPSFDPATLLGVALPLFLVTMASQNIPGIAVLAAHGYRPAPGPLFAATGLLSAAAAPFGAHAVNLAAITAALTAGPEAGRDPAGRWWAAAVAGGGYLGCGLLAGPAVALAGAAAPVLVQAVAGLALLGAFGAALATALHDPAVVAFLISGSGVAVFGIGGAFWGLLAGVALRRLRRPARSSPQ